jgi:hypothetical protein
MKKPLLLLALCFAAASAHADTVALGQAEALAGGASANAVMDGATGSGTVTADATPGGERRTVPTTSRGNITIGGRTPAAPSRTSGESRPGFFSRMWSSVKKPSFLIPAGTALAFAAGGAMVAGPIGALTGALIGGLLGFIFTKALG